MIVLPIATLSSLAAAAYSVSSRYDNVRNSRDATFLQAQRRQHAAVPPMAYCNFHGNNKPIPLELFGVGRTQQLYPSSRRESASSVAYRYGHRLKVPTLVTTTCTLVIMAVATTVVLPFWKALVRTRLEGCEDGDTNVDVDGVADADADVAMDDETPTYSEKTVPEMSQPATVPSSKSPPPKHKRRRATLEDDTPEIFETGLSLTPIGKVRSIYQLCVGTPRQGLLAPHARGRLELTLEPHAAIGLEEYSHVWVVFVFHLNTIRNSSSAFRNKVSPPALGGKKVGILATRTPHRPNPIGVTLCRLDSITSKTTITSKGAKKKTVVLNVSGLDLVDGTPILDVKPYISEYDSVGSSTLTNGQIQAASTSPSWVSGGLSTRRTVTISLEAKQQLEDILQTNPKALEFYGTHRGDSSWKDSMRHVLHAIEEVLSTDVRSTYQTKKMRNGSFRAERADRVQATAELRNSKDKDFDESANDFYESTVDGNVSGCEHEEDELLVCTQQLDNLMISYTAAAKPFVQDNSASKGSGAEDEISVRSIQLSK